MAYLRGQIITGSSIISGETVVSGSFTIEASESADFFIIKSGSAELLKANSDGIMQFHVFEDSYIPSSSLGGIFFHSSSMYVGLDI